MNLTHNTPPPTTMHIHKHLQSKYAKQKESLVHKFAAAATDSLTTAVSVASNERTQTYRHGDTATLEIGLDHRHIIVHADFQRLFRTVMLVCSVDTINHITINHITIHPSPSMHMHMHKVRKGHRQTQTMSVDLHSS